jgi:hypothetical protein
MKNRALHSIVVVIALLLLVGCGEGETVVFASFNGSTNQNTGESTDRTSEASSGLVIIVLTDAEPVLPSGTEEVLITVEEVLIHREGGEWISLPLVQTPYTIDLLRFHSGNTTDLIRPVSLESGTYDRIRLIIDNASVVNNGVTYPITISPEKSTIEKDFLFDLGDGGFADLTVDFDLSQSLGVTKFSLAPSYELTPFLHINHTEEAVLISGEIAPMTFDDHSSSEAIVAVFMDNDLSGNLTADDEEYTRIRVDRDSPEFAIFWLIPEEGYTVAVEIDGREPTEYEQFMYPADLQRGGVFELNHGNLI